MHLPAAIASEFRNLSRSTHKLIRFLQDRQIHLVLVDVGASGAAWGAFKIFLPVAELLRFDPDSRAMVSLGGDGSHKRITFNKAVTESAAATVDFHLTRSPFCSSTLPPDFDRIRDYAYEELFEVLAKKKLPAITLQEALRQVELDRVDWLKLDTQGTELRIIQSLPRSLLDRLLVCDVEASLYPHYVGADLMPEVQRFFISEDFWISALKTHQRTRLSKLHWDKLQNVESSRFLQRVQQSTMHRGPTTLELTYARTLRGAARARLDEEGLIRLFACHFALGAFEYCFQIAATLRERGGAEMTARSLADIALSAIRERTRKMIPNYLMNALRTNGIRFWRKVCR